MAGGMDLDSSSKGGKKALDAAINLVPFIDLMAVTISFLIMTAVWAQIGRLQVSQQANGAPGDATAEPPLAIILLITGQQLQLAVGGVANDPIPFARDARGRLELQKLKARLSELKASRPEAVAITLKTEDSVRYDDLVRVIDECIGDGLSAVQVSPASG